MGRGRRRSRHHTVTDTFEHIDARKLAMDTAVLAILAWELADAAEPIGRRLSAPEAGQLLEKAGVSGTKRMVYGASAR